MVWTWCSNSAWWRPRVFHLGSTGDLLPVASLPSTVCSCRRIAGSRHRVQTAPLEPRQHGADTEASLVALTHDLPLHPLICAPKARYSKKEGCSSAGIVDYRSSHPGQCVHASQKKSAQSEGAWRYPRVVFQEKPRDKQCCCD